MKNLGEAMKHKILVFWPVVVTLVVVAAGVGAAQYRINYLEKQQSKLERQQEKLYTMAVEHNSRLARLEEATGLLPEIRSDLKLLLRRHSK